MGFPPRAAQASAGLLSCSRLGIAGNTMRDGRTRGESRGGPDGTRREAAEALAVAALAFLATEPEHLGGFLASTGIGPGDIRSASRDPSFLSGVLDHFSSDEALLVAFAQHAGIDPTEIQRARHALGGVWERDAP
jgi:hypothetical protein